MWLFFTVWLWLRPGVVIRPVLVWGANCPPTLPFFPPLPRKDEMQNSSPNLIRKWHLKYLRLHIWDHQPTHFLYRFTTTSTQLIYHHYSTVNHQSVIYCHTLLSIECFTSLSCHVSHYWLYCQYHHFVFLMLEWFCNSPLCHSFLWAPPVSVSRPHIGCSLPRGALHTKQDLTLASPASAPITPRVAQNWETFRDFDEKKLQLVIHHYYKWL